MTQHFAVLPSGDVYSFGKRDALDYAERVENAMYATDDEEGGLSNVPMPVLITLYNTVRPERPVTRFADRATAEKRLKGVLETLAKPGTIAPPAPDRTEEESAATDGTTNDAPPASPESPAANDAPTEDTTMAGTKTKGKRAAAKKSAAKKTTGTRTPRTEAISDATLERVKKMRDDGKNWDEIRAALGGLTVAFVFRVRPMLKKRWPSSVRNIGPGSAGYGKGSKKKNGGK